MRAYNFLFVVSFFLSFGLLIESKLAITHIGLTSKDKQSIKEAFLVNVNAYTGRWKTCTQNNLFRLLIPSNKINQ
jgi:hypothetical protein